MRLSNSMQCLAAVALFLALTFSYSHAQIQCFPGESPQLPTPAFRRSVESFGLTLFRELSAVIPGNLFMSPYSLWSVLTLAYFGSDGETRRQMELALRLNSKPGTYTNWNAVRFMLRQNRGIQFKSLNKAYFSDRLFLNPCFKTIIFDLQEIDFTNATGATNHINSEVSRTTEGKIKNFIDFLPASTRFVLINAVFFKGIWHTEFDPRRTRKQEFLVPPGRSAGNVDMMVTEGRFKHVFSEALQASILQLPYKDSSVSMYIFLPNSWSIDPVLNNLSVRSLNEGIQRLTPKNVEIAVPKFSMKTKMENELKDVLYKLGLHDLFSAGVANFTAFTKTESLFIDSAIHEATIDVDEEGTVAAAASGLLNTRFGGETVKFVCNRPFIFLINDGLTGITLFAGKYEVPPTQ